VKTPQQAMDALAAAQNEVLGRLERANVQGECGPKLNPARPAPRPCKPGRLAECQDFGCGTMRI